jgi:RNA polymerase sigma factor (sigma-70 family)
MEGRLGELNQKLRKAKSDGKWAKKIINEINYEKAALIRDKSNLDTINSIGGESIVSFISTDYRRINGMSDMVSKLAKSMSNGESEYQSELESAGYVGLTKALNKWDEKMDNDAKWSTFAYPFVRNEMVDYTRKNERWTKMEYRDDIDISVLDFNSSTSEEIVLKKEELQAARRVFHRVQKQSNERELYVLWHYIFTEEPMTIREIAEQFQCGKSSIQRDVERLTVALRKGSI